MPSLCAILSAVLKPRAVRPCRCARSDSWTLGGQYLDVRLLFVPYLIHGAGDMALGLVVGLPWALLILFVYGLNTSTGMVASNTILQTVIPDRVRGRVFTLLDVTWAAMRLLSLGVGGWLADRAGISSVYVIGGALLTLAGVLGLVLLGRVPLGAPSCPTPQSGHASGAPA